MTRAYTVAEIDDMRKAISNYGYPDDFSWNTQERERSIEDRLRTYMLAGIDPLVLKTELLAVYLERRQYWNEIVDTEIDGRGHEWQVHRNGQKSRITGETSE